MNRRIIRIGLAFSLYANHYPGIIGILKFSNRTWYFEEIHSGKSIQHLPHHLFSYFFASLKSHLLNDFLKEIFLQITPPDPLRIHARHFGIRTEMDAMEIFNPR